MRRGQLYLAKYDPVVGSEIGKTRPALIVQNNYGNKFSNIVICVSITRLHDLELATLVHVKESMFGLEKPSTINCSQIRSLDKSRLVHKIGELDEETMQRVDEALKISIDLI